MRTSLVTLALLVASSSAARLGSDRHGQGLARRHYTKRNQANKAALDAAQKGAGVNEAQLLDQEGNEAQLLDQEDNEAQVVTTTDASGAQCTIAAADLAGALELANAAAAAQPTAPPQAGEFNVAESSSASSSSESSSSSPTAAPSVGARRMLRRNKAAGPAEAGPAEKGAPAAGGQKEQAPPVANELKDNKAAKAGEGEQAQQNEADLAQQEDQAVNEDLPECGPFAAEAEEANLADLNDEAANLAAEVCPPPVTVTVSPSAAAGQTPALNPGRKQNKQQNDRKKGGKGKGRVNKQQKGGDDERKANKGAALDNANQLLALIQALQAQHDGPAADARRGRGQGRDHERRQQLSEAAESALWAESVAANAGNDKMKRQLSEAEEKALWADSVAANAGNDKRHYS